MTIVILVNKSERLLINENTVILFDTKQVFLGLILCYFEYIKAAEKRRKLGDITKIGSKFCDENYK